MLGDKREMWVEVRLQWLFVVEPYLQLWSTTSSIHWYMVLLLFCALLFFSMQSRKVVGS